MSVKTKSKKESTVNNSGQIKNIPDKDLQITRGFKGFGKDLRCRGFQYEPGKTFTEECDPKLCQRGFHFCEYPLDIFSYYPPAGSRFCTVETPCASSETESNDSKRVTKTLTIGAEIDIAGLVKAAFEYTWSRTTLEAGNTASGDRGAAQASGYRGAAQASGYQGAAQASGDRGAAQASGYQGAAQASGYQGAAQASGDQGAAQASGDYSVALAAGYEAKAKGKLGCAICCVEREDWQTGKILAVKAAIVDGDTIKADTWYTLRGGEFVEVAA